MGESDWQAGWLRDGRFLMPQGRRFLIDWRRPFSPDVDQAVSEGPVRVQQQAHSTLELSE
jgi:hypothetical protein